MNKCVSDRQLAKASAQVARRRTRTNATNNDYSQQQQGGGSGLTPEGLSQIMLSQMALGVVQEALNESNVSTW